MKLLWFLASLFAAAQAQFFIGAPQSGATVSAGQNVTVQIISSPSPATGREEVGLVIGIVACGSSACPSPSANLGQIIYIGKFASQGSINNSGNPFQTFNFIFPSGISGKASIQVQHIFVDTPTGHATFTTEHSSVTVNVASSPATSNIHPNGNTAKCIGFTPGAYAAGTPVDIFDCNGANTQAWQWNGNAVTTINPADGSLWCLDAGTQSKWANGVQMQISQCSSKLAQQAWAPVSKSGSIKLVAGNFCLVLPNGDTTNGNVIQIGTCAAGNTQQVWNLTPSTSPPITAGSFHPNGDTTKCFGFTPGSYADGTEVDIFDCNGAVTQDWVFNTSAISTTNPADGSQWCLDAGAQSQWANGVKIQISKCANTPQQSWTPITISGTVKLTTANFCLLLPNGIKTNGNVLQISACNAGNVNEIWTLTAYN